MKKYLAYSLAVMCVLLGLFFIQQVLFPKASSANTPSKADVQAKLRGLTIPFVANQGQTDKQVQFYAQTFGGTVFVTKTGTIVYSLPKVVDERPTAGAVIRERSLHAKTQYVTGEERSPAVVNSFKGNDRSKWKRGLPTFDIIHLGEVAEGVDLKLRAHGYNVEKLFYVRPQADPSSIAMTLDGAKQLTVNKEGELEVLTKLGTVKFTRPVAYQEINGKRSDVEVSYAILDSKPETRNSKLDSLDLGYQFPQVRILHRLILPDLRWRSRGQDLAVVEDRDPVRQGEDHIHVMLDDDDGLALGEPFD